MTIFQSVAMWSLRALLAWAAFEAGAALYAQGVERWSDLRRLSGHRTAMGRLEDRARAAEVELQALNAELAALNGDAWSIAPSAEETPAAAAAHRLRQTLIELGAEAPVVDAGLDGGRVALNARWREPAASAPQILHALAQRHPEFAVERLSLTNGDVAMTDIVLSTTITMTDAEP